MNDGKILVNTGQSSGRSYGTHIFPKWEIGKPIPSGALDGITRESVESQLAKSGNKLVKRSSVSGSSLDIQV